MLFISKRKMGQSAELTAPGSARLAAIIFSEDRLLPRCLPFGTGRPEPCPTGGRGRGRGRGSPTIRSRSGQRPAGAPIPRPWPGAPCVSSSAPWLTAKRANAMPAITQGRADTVKSIIPAAPSRPRGLLPAPRRSGKQETPGSERCPWRCW